MFDSIVGHVDSYTLFLKMLQQNKLHHALILSGIQGIGKFTVAKEFTKILLSSNSNEDYSIKEEVANLVDKNSHGNLLLIQPEFDAKKQVFKNSIAVEQIRKINHFVHLSNSSNTYKVIIIDALDNLNNNGLNALLKILEEPTSRTIFFLISHNYSTLIDTIKSRSLNIKFQPLSNNEIELLSRNHNIDTLENYATLCKLAQGSFANFQYFHEHLALYKLLFIILNNKNNYETDCFTFLGKIKSVEKFNHSTVFNILIAFVTNNKQYNPLVKESLITTINTLQKQFSILNLDFNSVFLSIIFQIKEYS
jgi:DNA polymerase-3 subunit delta'